MANKLKVTLVKSPIGAVPKHKATVEALGLKKLNKTVELPDNPKASIVFLFLGTAPIVDLISVTFTFLSAISQFLLNPRFLLQICHEV